MIGRWEFRANENSYKEKQIDAIWDWQIHELGIDPNRVIELPKAEARESGVSGNFWDNYPDVVKVYTIEDAEGNILSREVCGGPHIKNTECLGKFKIVKEQSSSAGV